MQLQNNSWFKQSDCSNQLLFFATKESRCYRIVQGLFKVIAIRKEKGMAHLSLGLSPELVENLQIGASVAVNGTCLTVVSIQGLIVSFDVIQESLKRTNLSLLEVGHFVNVERSVRFGEEVGGHLVSGHVMCTTQVKQIERSENNCILTLELPIQYSKYLLSKGFVALDGASLTVVNVQANAFTVHLIPETLKRTTLGFRQEGDFVNLEIDSTTQTIVDTIEKCLPSIGKPSVCM